jgi:small subunit ribosomal protein S6
MKNFEAVLLLSSEISSKSRSNCLDNFTKIIIDNSGKILDSEDWGLRDLSYKINNFSKAFYSFYQIEIEGDKIENIKRNLSQDEKYVRYLFVKVEKHQELPTKLNNEKK